MKKLITALLTATLLVASSVYADCNKKEVDANSKFDAAMTLLDVMEVVDSNEAQVRDAHKEVTASNTNTVKLLIAYKQENIDFNCDIEQLNKFSTTSKTNIKVFLPKMNDYLQQKIQWNLELLNAINAVNSSNLNTFENNIADLAIKNKSLYKLYGEATLSILQVIQFEKIDNEKAHITEVNGGYYNKLWITDNERKLLLKKIASFNVDKIVMQETLFGLYLLVDYQLGYKNKDVETMEVIKKKYEH